MTSAGAHWHGFGPWTGLQATFERSNEGRRRPADPSFLQSQEPPVQLGHYLLRRSQTKRQLTWTDVDAGLAWMAATYGARPPDSRLGYESLEAKVEHTRAGLLGGSDGYWQYDLSSNRTVAIAVICCPHSHLTATPCPLPPI